MNLVAPDYTPTAETISLHGLGFIQVKLPADRRLHVWHPDLPRRSCYAVSSIHNHRFAFRSTVLKGMQLNQRWQISLNPHGTHDVISHNGPRSSLGGRQSFVAAQCDIVGVGHCERILEGGSYEMAELEYHHTPCEGIVVTLMEKLSEGKIHATSLITRGHVFDQSFDRFQLSPSELWAFVVDALSS